ncbi:MAG: amidohydrolase family protein [Candidatus Roizmanbacteria bacterium]|nr:amidohydrolase family protein [Candidatus Roizmanbacteria bacterium]
MKFVDVHDLIRLPYFAINSDKKLVLKPQYKKYRIIDAHTHLGWSYLFSRKIDLTILHEKTHYFFPERNNSFDITHYTAVDFEEKNAKKARFETIRGAFNRQGYSKTHTIPNLLNEMDRMGIKRSIVLAIDFPLVSNNSEHILKSIALHEDGKKRLIPFISLHPMERNKEKKLKRFIALGAKGIKLHPQIQLFKPTHKGAYEIYELAKTYNIPILFHTGLSPISPEWQRRYVEFSHFKKMCADFPDNLFIFGHAGVLDYKEAIVLSKKYKKVYLELSGQPPQIIKEMININGYEKLFFGSDWPYYPSILPLAKVLLATEGMKDSIRQALLGGNIENIVGI